MKDRKTLLLRFAELELRKVRREITLEEEIELDNILSDLAIPREQALEEAKKVVIDSYDKSS